MYDTVEDRHSVPTTCCRRVVMICTNSNFDEILEEFTKFLIGKKMIERLSFKCVNVCNVTCAHVCNMQIVQPMKFPHLPMCCTQIFHVPNYPTSFPAFPSNIFRFEVVKHV
jgi:hypothetical protein